MTDALAALYGSIRTTLSTANEAWGNSGTNSRAYADLAPAGVSRPYVIYSLAGGGELNAVVRQDAEFVVVIKIITEEELATAMTAANRISALFNDVDGGALSTAAGWTIIHIKQEQRVHYTEMVEGKRLYHTGHRFRFRMEAT
jgi:hypothetical protein